MTQPTTPPDQAAQTVDKVAEFELKLKAISICVQAEIPFLLVGTPGNAKTAIVEAIFRQTCADYYTSIPALNDPAHYAGYPSRGKDQAGDTVAVMLPNNWVRRLARNGERKERVGIFLDELSSAPPATRAACLRGILEGAWGDHAIPHSCPGAAMNPPELAESGYDLSAPLANRFCHFTWDPPSLWWDEQRMQGFPDPEIIALDPDWKRQLQSVHVLHSAFVRARPALVQACPDSAEERSHAWPSFRTWTWACELLAASYSAGAGPETDLALILVSAAVGGGPAREFLTYCQKLDLPDPEALLRDPRSLHLPRRGDRAYACLTSVVAAVLGHNTPSRWEAAWEVLKQASEMGRPDVAAVACRLLAKNKPDGVTRTPEAIGAFVPLLRAAKLLE